MTEIPAGGEGPTVGASGILGTNNLQRAIDTFDRTVDKLSTIAARLGDASTSFGKGQKAGGSWNQFSNWAGGSNGGGASFNGTPFNPNNGGSPGAAAGSHRAAGPAQYQSTGMGGGGAHKGTGNGFSKAAFAIGAASSVASSINSVTGQTRDNANADRMLYSTTAYSMNYGGGTVDATSLFSRYRGNFMSGSDAAQGIASLGQMAGYAPNTAGFNRLQSFGNQTSLSNPTMTGAQAYANTGSMYTPQTYGNLRRVGITTIDQGGNRRSPLDIANQVIKQVDPSGTITTKDQIAALMTDPMSNLNLTLGNWVSNGLITGDQVESIKGSIQSILQARSHGTNTSQLQTLMNNYGNGNTAAAKTLSSMGIGASDINKEKNLGAAQRQGAVNNISSFDKGLKESTASLTGLTDALNAFKKASGISEISGLKSGLTAHGKVGGVLGLASMAGPFGGIMGAFGQTGAGAEVGSLIGGAISAPFKAAGNLLGGIGGSDEGRMSVVSGGGGGGSTGGRPGSHAGSNSTSGGGKSSSGKSSTSSKGSGSSQKMAWPVNPHPLGTPFGAKGPMWQLGYHTGQDILVGTGTPVHAAANGTVIIAGWNSSYGYEIVINHGGGIYTRYAHNSRLVAHVGANVRQGQLISYSGATGNVTGPHLHFEVCVGGTGLRNAVNPLPYLSGSVSVPGTTSGSTTSTTTSGTTNTTSGQSTGSGSSTDNGTGTSYTASSGSGAAYGAGMSELDVLAAGSSGSGGGSMTVTTDPTSAGSSGSNTSGGTSTSTSSVIGTPVAPSVGGPPVTTPGNLNDGHRYSKLANEGAVLVQAKKYGWGNGKEWDNLYRLIMSESGFNNVAQNPTSSAYGIFQFLNSTWSGYGIKKTSDPTAQSIAGLKYIKSRYGDPVHAWAFKESHNWYDKGAWEIKDDETARVHKGEMILQKPAADQIRQILLNGNPYGVMGNKSQANQGVVLQFNEGSIKITMQGTGSGANDSRALAKSLVDNLMSDDRIQKLQSGVV